MDIEFKGIELPIFLIKEVFLENNNIKVKLAEDRQFDYAFNDNNSAARIYKKIVEKMKRKEKQIAKVFR